MPTTNDRTTGAKLRRLAIGGALAAALGAGGLSTIAAPAPAQAVESEEYTHAVANRTPRDEPTNKPSVWFVYLKAGETLTVEAGSHLPNAASWDEHKYRAFFTITDPAGNLVETNDSPDGYPAGSPARETGASMKEPDTQPQLVRADEHGEGIYRVALRGANSNLAHTSFPWRMTVADAAREDIPGRIWVETYRLEELTDEVPFASRFRGFDLDYWFVSEQGYEYELQLKRFLGMTSVIEASLLGNTNSDCVSLYHSLTDVAEIGYECNDKYNLFFEKPADDLPGFAPIAAGDASTNQPQAGATEMWVKPAPVEPTATITGYDSASVGSASKAGTLRYTLANFAGNYSIQVDADGNGSFDDAVDRSFPLSLPDGESGAGRALEFAFDGIDGLGQEIEADVRSMVRIHIEHFPELHFVFGDVEQLAGGLSLKRLNGGGDPAADKVYWNDSIPGANPGDPPTLLGTEACGPAGGLPAEGTSNPIVNTDGLLNVEGDRGLHYWDTDLGSYTATRNCINNNSSDTGSYGNEKLLDTWTYADVDIVAETLVLGSSLKVSKAAHADLGVALTPLEFTVTATNNGTEDLTADSGSPAVVKDSLGGLASAVDEATLRATIADAEVAPPTIVDGVLTWVGDLRAGEVVEIRYGLRIAPDGSTGTAVTNSVAAVAGANDPMPSAAECAEIAERISFNCATVETALAAPPTVTDSAQQVLAGGSVSFDVLGALTTPGSSQTLTVSLIDPKTGEPTTETSVSVAGGVWTLDPATGIVTFTAAADFTGETPPLEVRVTDGNGMISDATLRVSAKGAEVVDPGGSTPSKPTPPGLSQTGSADMMLVAGLGLLLVVGGATLVVRRVRTR